MLEHVQAQVRILGGAFLKHRCVSECPFSNTDLDVQRNPVNSLQSVTAFSLHIMFFVCARQSSRAKQVIRSCVVQNWAHFSKTSPP